MTRVVHRTRYTFEQPVAPGSEIETCLEPPCTSFHQLVLRPLPAHIEVSRDEFGNARRRARFDEPLVKLEIIATSVIEEAPPSNHVVSSFVGSSVRVPMLAECAAYAASDDVATLLRRIHADFSYDVSATDLDTPLARFVELRRGVCQDFAHFTIGCLRARGIPAGYVTGYSEASPASGHTHAWVSAFVDGGWLDLDPTLGRLGPLEHIELARGRDYDDVPPLRGSIAHQGHCRVESQITVS